MEFKTEEVKQGYDQLHPIVKELCEIADRWSKEHDKKPITLTESVTTPEHDKREGRRSPAHREGRAVDIRVKDWSTEKISQCVAFFNGKYAEMLGYVRLSNKQRILMYLHGEGDNRHIHMAIGNDVIERYKNSYPKWQAPVHTKIIRTRSPRKPKEV